MILLSRKDVNRRFYPYDLFDTPHKKGGCVGGGGGGWGKRCGGVRDVESPEGGTHLFMYVCTFICIIYILYLYIYIYTEKEREREREKEIEI